MPGLGGITMSSSNTDDATARHGETLARLRHAVLDAPARSTPELRTAAATGGELPEPLAAYVAKVRDQSYRVTDRDVERLTASGLSEDEIFELSIATALGAALRRFDAGLRAMREGA
jgi:hypothetical protein